MRHRSAWAFNNLCQRASVGCAAVATATLLAACGGSGGESEGADASGKSGSKEPIVLGSIYDATGPLAVVGKPKIDATELAIEDINAKGGVLGRRLEMKSLDAQSDNAKYTQYANQLILRDKVSALAAGITSASREAIRPIIDRTKTVYFYDQLYEGGVCDKNEFNTGPVPSQQLAKLIPYAIKKYGKRLFVAAADYNFGRISAGWVERYAKQFGGEIVQTKFVPLESTDFGSILNDVQRTKPDVFVSLLVGGNHISFYRQFASAGLQDDIKIITPLFGDGQEHVVLGPKVSKGVVVAFPYLQELDNPANKDFVEKWHAKFGDDYPYITNSAVAVWNNWHLWAAAVEKAGSLDRDKVVKALESGISIDSPSGKVTMDGRSHHVVQNVALAEGSGNGFKILEEFEDVPPAFEQETCDLIANPTLNKQFLP